MKLLVIVTGIMGAVAGCARMDVPANFVELDGANRGNYDLRAVSADGLVVALQTRENPKKGTLEFWSKAIANEMTANRGYTLDKSEEVAFAGGGKGVLMAFTSQRSGAKFSYMLALCVKWNSVVIAEAGGKGDAFAPRQEDIRRSLLSVRI